jgi:hypothetical protein
MSDTPRVRISIKLAPDTRSVVTPPHNLYEHMAEQWRRPRFVFVLGRKEG